ncbi:MAG: 4-hydroxythreonine-4-phosphate dehydrogenase PdxA [Nitrospiraceae bacterium]|nr:MAG: 4-hydroxythreonine-4-phosphate dehydrogenase PdxA [Nitrospiraceae bacterium]
MKQKKAIAITMGDPGGIGPEVIVKAIAGGAGKHCVPLVIGDAELMKAACRLSKLPLRVRPVSCAAEVQPGMGGINVIDVRSRLSSRQGVPTAAAGRAFIGYLDRAVELAVSGEVQGIVTAPISKESLKMAGYSWPGHTEFLAERTGTRECAMMFVSPRLKVILCTIHIPLRDVPRKINGQRVAQTIRLAKKGMDMLGISNPRIAVAGLNPHAGESGIMGKEEAEAIIPAVERARQDGLPVSGPFPPDVVFHKAWRGEYDIIVCMYHDQGLVPFKMVAFDRGVNVTVGLPVIRTSPDHGTAFDIAWENRADPSSMIEAIKLAAKMKLRRSS